MIQSRLAVGLAALVAGAAFVAAPQAQAQAIDANVVNASGACNGALPTFEGSLRKRPAGIVNIGTTNSFVSCSLVASDLAEGAWAFGVFFTNQNDTEQTVECTFVDGSVYTGLNFYVASITLEANGGDGLVWEADDEMFTNYTNVSCNLPGGVDINDLFNVSLFDL